MPTSYSSYCVPHSNETLQKRQQKDENQLDAGETTYGTLNHPQQHRRQPQAEALRYLAEYGRLHTRVV